MLISNVKYGFRRKTSYVTKLSFSWKLLRLSLVKSFAVFSENPGNSLGNLTSFSFFFTEVGFCFDNVGSFHVVIESFSLLFVVSAVSNFWKIGGYHFASFAKLCFTSVTLTQASVIGQLPWTFPILSTTRKKFLDFDQEGEYPRLERWLCRRSRILY